MMGHLSAAALHLELLDTDSYLDTNPSLQVLAREDSAALFPFILCKTTAQAYKATNYFLLLAFLPPSVPSSKLPHADLLPSRKLHSLQTRLYLSPELIPCPLPPNHAELFSKFFECSL